MTDTTQAPERIWAYSDNEFNANIWYSQNDPRYTPAQAVEYIRADLAQPEQVAVVKPLVWDHNEEYPDTSQADAQVIAQEIALKFAGKILAHTAFPTVAGAAHEHFVQQIVNGKLSTGPISWLPSALGDAVKDELRELAEKDSPKSDCAKAVAKKAMCPICNGSGRKNSATICGHCHGDGSVVVSALAGKADELTIPALLTYKNYRGKVSVRTITPSTVWFGTTEWHPEEQWFLSAFDHDKKEHRDFALRDFCAPKPAALPQVNLAAVEALANYEQADIHGTMVRVSRQAVEECLTALRELAENDAQADLNALKYLDEWVEGWMEKIDQDITDHDRGEIADDMARDWYGAGVGASIKQTLAEKDGA